MKNNKILLVSPFNSSFTYPIYRAFKALKYNAKIFDYRHILGNLKYDLLLNLLLLLGSINKLFSKSRRIRLLNVLLIDVCKKYKPSYLFVIKGETIDQDTISALNKLGVTTILWQVDSSFDPIIWPYVNKAGRKYKYYISCEPGKIITKLKKRGFKKVLYMLGAADGFNMKFLYNKVPKKYSITLVGSYHPDREKYLLALKGLDVHVWGWGNWKESKVAEMYEGKALTQKQMLDVYSKSKIIFDINRNPNSTIPTNLRPFEASQVGGFILAKYNNNINRVFKLGKEIDTFTSPQNLREKVLFYLKNNRKREQIAKNMYQKVLKKHLYIHRISAIFEDINK